jgi:alpha-L-fucosidase 2
MPKPLIIRVLSANMAILPLPAFMRISCLVLVALASLFTPVSAQSPASSPLTLWYQKPATDAMSEALPVGNGRIGGVVFGGIEKERIQFNVDSLWTGNDTGDYGAYQKLGDLFLGFELGPKALVTSPSGQPANESSQGVECSVDGNLSTKWCVVMDGKPVIWQAQSLSGPRVVTSYTLVSAEDVPERDPKSWEFSGSLDGQEWTTLDKQDDQPSFENRHQSKTFTFSNTTAYNYYRLTINDNHGDRLMQLAEINVPGMQPNSSAGTITDYRRQLDLSTAVARTTFTRDGVPYTREVFASHPDQVIAIRWSSSQKGAVSGTIEMAGAHIEKTGVDGNTLSFSGKLGNGLQYAAIARVIPHGGTMEKVDDTLQIKGADDVVVLLAAATDFTFDYSQRNKSGIDPHDALVAQLDAASAKSYDALKADHIKDFQALFNRVAADFGKSTDAQLALPIDQRKIQAMTTVDPELEALVFQYGRYLLISSSRSGGMPANLQGLWNDSNDPPWQCDYHANINIQMNYWPADTTNIAECDLPLFDWMQSMQEPWKKNTAAEPDFALPSGAPMRTGLNEWGSGTFVWDKTANAWLCQQLWEHYAFGGDKDYLRNVAYPIIKEIVEFWEDHLKTLPDGRLVVPNGWSPEHGPHEDGVTYNQEIVWDLFTNYMDASDALGIDQDYRDKIAGMRDKLVGPVIGKWGQIQEWMEDRDDPKDGMEDRDNPNDHHRHTSHLFAVFPGRQISVEKTPELAKAAKVSLDARGISEGATEWSLAWRTALYARLHDAASAHTMLQNFFSDHDTCPNMLGLCPPMQMDGDFGMSAGIAEILLQSQAGEINLLPALPDAWPTGSVKGLQARGGFVVDMAWQDGKLTSATIHSTWGTGGTVRYGDKTANLNLTPGKSVQISGSLL